MIIPAYNGEKFLSDCVSSVLNQHYENFEIVIIDDGSIDGTYDLACSFRSEKPLSIIRHERNLGLAATYNHGLEGSRGKFILLLHQDCRLGSSDWLEKAEKHFSDPYIAVVTGQVLLDLNDMSFTQRTFTFLRGIIPSKTPSPSEGIPFFEGKCDLCRKEVLLALGGFPSHEFMFSGEDQVVSYALRQRGYKILKDNTLVFREKISEGFRNNFRKEFVHGKTQAGISFKFGLFQLKGLGASHHMRSRAINKLSRLAIVFTIFVLLAMSLAIRFELIVLPVLILVGRSIFFAITSTLHPIIKFTLPEAIATSIIGVLSDFIYSLGFLYGLFLSIFKRRL